MPYFHGGCSCNRCNLGCNRDAVEGTREQLVYVNVLMSWDRGTSYDRHFGDRPGEREMSEGNNNDAVFHN